MDGTFNVFPKYFTQLFTIHGFKDDIYIYTYIPLVIFVLPYKQTKRASVQFIWLIALYSLHGMTLAPCLQVFVDFAEIAIHIWAYGSREHAANDGADFI